jgi:hypothetical protein
MILGGERNQGSDRDVGKRRKIRTEERFNALKHQIDRNIVDGRSLDPMRRRLLHRSFRPAVSRLKPNGSKPSRIF